MFLRNVFLFSLSVALSSFANAQDSGGKILRIVVALGAGTPSDSISRLIAPHLSKHLGHPVVVDNKPGANGVIAVQEVMRSKPDGNTVLMGSVSPLAINTALVKNLPYEPRKDLTPIGVAYTASQAWMVKNDHPLRSFADLIEFAKRNPGKLRAGSYSALTQIQFEAIKRSAGIDILIAPYRATSATYTDLLGGVIDVAIVDMATSIVQSKGGVMRALGITAEKRSPLAPDWPAVSESVPGYNFSSWSALVGPPGMSKDSVDRINAALVKTLQTPEIQQKLSESAAIAWPTTASELQNHIEKEVTRWGRLAREANIEPQ